MKTDKGFTVVKNYKLTADVDMIKQLLSPNDKRISSRAAKSSLEKLVPDYYFSEEHNNCDNLAGEGSNQ